jgi:hypothetical protein
MMRSSISAFCPLPRDDAYYRRNERAGSNRKPEPGYGGPVAVVPGSYITFFAAVTGAAAALIGLLFVSVSLRADTVFGDNAPERGKSLAAAAFTGLVNVFFLALAALVPRSNLGYPSAALAVSSLISTVAFYSNRSHTRSQVVYLLLSLSAFTFELVEGVYLIVQPRGNSGVESLAYLMIGSMAISLGRAWALLQGKHIVEAKKAPATSTE